MKAIKFLQITAFLILTLTVAVSCVDGEEYDVPPTATQVEPDVTVNSSIQAIKSAMDQHFASNDEFKMTYDDDSSVVFEGYVVSSDLAGNFFESLIIQDSPSNPSHGIEVLIDKSALFETFEVGRKVYVKMAGLSVSYEDGEDNDPSDTGNIGRYSIGDDQGGFGLDGISQFSYLNHILRSTESGTIIPTPVAMSDLTQDHINTFIQLSNMQFDANELGKTFAGEGSDSFDGFRNLVSCADESTATLQTSTFADFKSYTIPENVGTINATLAKDYRADFLVLVINTPTDLDFTNTDRCDPVILECDGPTSTTNTIFSEDFQAVFNDGDLTALGWTNVNVSGGSELFESNSFSGDRYMKVSAFGTGENPMETWLVSPAINLDGSTEEELSFEISANFESGLVLSALITENYTGDPTTTEWTQLDVAIPVGGGGFGSFALLKTNISCLNGDVNVAFKYNGSAGAAETRYHIDDVKVTGM